LPRLEEDPVAGTDDHDRPASAITGTGQLRLKPR